MKKTSTLPATQSVPVRHPGAPKSYHTFIKVEWVEERE